MDHGELIRAARSRMGAVFTQNQLIGRTLTTGCAAVEITQRCNLDCTLCYLSEHSEHVADVPVEEVFRRLDEVRNRFGARTNVQITGGDPTLRKHHELVEIVRYARDLELFPALFTNGIAASRRLLADLAAAGLCDVAFHVDTTQRRRGYHSEADLNALRLEYLDRTRGLGLMVVFNTTVHRGNFGELESLTRFFIRHADRIGLASYQLQADTGRGEWRERDEAITLDSVRRRIERAMRPQLPWETIRIGHPACHSYLPTLVANGRAYPVIDDAPLFASFVAALDGAHADRQLGRMHVARRYALALAARPRWALRALAFGARHLWRMKGDLLRCGARVHKLSFFVHNFMDAGALDQERVGACSFMVMTADGPLSMCAHNAERDRHILKPIRFVRRDGRRALYEPLAGRSARSASPEMPA